MNVSYMPILLWKPAEKGALRDLKDNEKKKIRPLIQFLPKSKKSKENPRELIPTPRDVVLKNELKYIEEYLGDIKLFLDLDLLYTSNKDEAFSIVSNSSGLFANNIIPVLTINDIENLRFDD